MDGGCFLFVVRCVVCVVCLFGVCGSMIDVVCCLVFVVCRVLCCVHVVCWLMF